jgi:hypothetical protein
MKQAREHIKLIRGDRPETKSPYEFSAWCDKCQEDMPTTHVYIHMSEKEVKTNG